MKSPDPAEVAVLARLAGLTIHADHLPGVVAYLALFHAEAALLFDPPIAATVEPAPAFSA